MSNYQRDNGSFATGMFTAIVVVAAFICGYALRDSGVQINIKTPIQQQRK
jgi:hypothetical protein